MNKQKLRNNILINVIPKDILWYIINQYTNPCIGFGESNYSNSAYIISFNYINHNRNDFLYLGISAVIFENPVYE